MRQQLCSDLDGVNFNALFLKVVEMELGGKFRQSDEEANALRLRRERKHDSD